MPRHPQTVIDLEGPIEIRIIEQPLPPNWRSRLFKTPAHDNAQLVRKLMNRVFEKQCIVSRSFGVMNRAGPGDHKQAMIFAAENIADLLARVVDGRGSPLRSRQLLFKKQW